MKRIPLTRPYFTGEELERIGRVLDSGWVTQGPLVAEFEQAFARLTGSRHALALNSCTAALHLALLALNISEDDEVIVPAFTFAASANVVEHCRARTVFCDIDPSTYTIDTNQIESCITPCTKAIMPVHLFGLSADMGNILELARKYGLAVIEDAACGFGCLYQGHHVGTLGDIGCFSFHPRKAITTGEGGMATTNSKDIAKRIQSLRDHGAVISDLDRHLSGRPYALPDMDEPGFNYRLTDIQAALGISQLEKADTIQQARRSWARRYDQALDDVSWLKAPVSPQGFVHGYQSYVCLFEPEKIDVKNVEYVNTRRNAFMDHLQTRGVASRPGTQAVHMLNYYKQRYNLKPENYPHTLIANLCSVTLPLYADMTEDEFGYVMDAIKEFNPLCAG
ncbi:MAG: DegT/DnrJ/EryC1/StrS aminotransferase family protein [Deltaproteobacteria bacterium]|nr:DegT/DnrJ/EryC1/StrS aminotransferase family protein [Deltaproteobacteria bacterium]